LPVSSRDRASFLISLHVDLTSIFHWNVKQVFLYLIACYSTNEFQLNEMIVWDKIIDRREDAIVYYPRLYNKYPLIDFENGLRNRTVTFKLNWSITPFAGRVVMCYSNSNHWINYTLPEEYFDANIDDDFDTYEDRY
jgi:signal peptidase complex subunit 3